MTTNPERVWVSNILGKKHRMGLVVLHYGQGQQFQFSPDEARDIALHLLECAEAASQEGWLFELLQEKLGVEDKGTALLLGDLRDYRLKKQEEFTQQQAQGAEHDDA